MVLNFSGYNWNVRRPTLSSWESTTGQCNVKMAVLLPQQLLCGITITTTGEQTTTGDLLNE